MIKLHADMKFCTYKEIKLGDFTAKQFTLFECKRRLIWERETPLSMAAASGESGRTQLERLYKIGRL